MGNENSAVEAQAPAESIDQNREEKVYNSTTDNGVVCTEPPAAHIDQGVHPLQDVPGRTTEEEEKRRGDEDEDLEFPHDFLPSTDLSLELHWGTSLGIMELPAHSDFNSVSLPTLLPGWCHPPPWISGIPTMLTQFPQTSFTPACCHNHGGVLHPSYPLSPPTLLLERELRNAFQEATVDSIISADQHEESQDSNNTQRGNETKESADKVLCLKQSLSLKSEDKGGRSTEPVLDPRSHCQSQTQDSGSNTEGSTETEDRDCLKQSQERKLDPEEETLGPVLRELQQSSATVNPSVSTTPEPEPEQKLKFLRVKLYAP
ncbi:hypothetical protein J4Q44_G00274540 [Coregonus suidteri]|uniref:Uncharacterized protein n=1 Tax=Coregonus suidteri TaxID=861788 RepID=A0AAN8QJU8_9TELE